jgi:hypothetical protein
VGSFDFSNFAKGAAYIFVRDGTTWSLQKRIEGSDAGGGSLFGSAVAISGDTVVIGAPGFGANFVSTIQKGAAYVFERSNGNWAQQKKLEAEDGAREDQFGFSVDISGNTIIVGAPFHDVDTAGGTNEDQGQAYAFVRESGPYFVNAFIISREYRQRFGP